MGTQVLEMKQEIGELRIRHMDLLGRWKHPGTVYRHLQRSGLADGLEILECQGLKFSKDGRLLRIETVGEGGGSLELSLRSGGLETDE